jgi:hypothetical protein
MSDPMNDPALADPRLGTPEVLAASEAYNRALALLVEPELHALQAAIMDAEGIESGDPWRQPLGAMDAYPLGAIVSHNGGTWESTVAANVWEPGVSGWKPSGPGIPPWVAPTGAHDAYAKDDVVTHEGKTWRSNIDANVWEPPEQWTDITDEEE